MSTMTQVAEGLRNNAADLDRMDMLPMLAGYLRNAADAIDAHLAQPAQAVDVGADFHAMNSALCDFAMRWEIDGDYMRCRKCKRPQLTDYASHDFPHSADCKAAGKVETRPWETFAQLMASLYPAISGAKAGPVDGWISVKERLPERNKPAIYWHKSEFGGFAAIADEWRDEHHLAQATHWMPYIAPASPAPDKEGL